MPYHQHEYTTDIHVFPILKLPPRTIPLGHPSAPAPSTLYHASNLDWQFISHVIIYMFQCHSLKSFHPRPLPQSPKDCSIYQCLFCCLAYRVIVTIFLNSIYTCYYTVLVFFFLTYFTLYNRLQFHLPHSWVLFHCVYVPQLSYSFIKSRKFMNLFHSTCPQITLKCPICSLVGGQETHGQL